MPRDFAAFVKSGPWVVGDAEKNGLHRHLPLHASCDGPSSDKVAEYPLIHLLHLRRTGWQVQRASMQESAAKGRINNNYVGLLERGERKPTIDVAE